METAPDENKSWTRLCTNQVLHKGKAFSYYKIGFCLLSSLWPFYWMSINFLKVFYKTKVISISMKGKGETLELHLSLNKSMLLLSSNALRIVNDICQDF